MTRPITHYARSGDVQLRLSYSSAHLISCGFPDSSRTLSSQSVPKGGYDAGAMPDIRSDGRIVPDATARDRPLAADRPEGSGSFRMRTNVITLANAIRKGAMQRQQCRGYWWRRDKRGVPIASCALGAAWDGLVGPWMGEFESEDDRRAFTDAFGAGPFRTHG
jgi:hypothetical protein